MCNLFSRTTAFCVMGALAAFSDRTLAFSLAIARCKSSPTTALQAASGRRAFVGAMVSSTVLSSPAFADEGGAVDDLSMPTSDQKDEDAAMAERLRKKAELKKKLARPTNYMDSLKGEQEKKKELKMTKEERRNALCEELGRGC